MKNILFICIENSCRSQIAEGFVNKFGVGIAKAYSAGSKPSGSVNVSAIEVMLEVGIDLSGNKSKGFSDLPGVSFDYVITLGCNDVCPYVPAVKRMTWDIPDPKGKDIDYFRMTRKIIKTHVEHLIAQLKEQKS